MLAERLARLLGAVLMLAALAGSVLAGNLDAGATDVSKNGFEWGASFGVATVDGPAAGVLSLDSAVVTDGNV